MWLWRVTGRGQDVSLLHYTDSRFDSIEREMSHRWRESESEFDRRIRALENKHDGDMSAVREATAIASGALSQRLDAMNEFRLAISDQAAQMVTTVTYNARAAAVDNRIDKIEASLDRARGRQVAYASIAAVSGVILTLVVLLAAHVHVT